MSMCQLWKFYFKQPTGKEKFQKDCLIEILIYDVSILLIWLTTKISQAYSQLEKS